MLTSADVARQLMRACIAAALAVVVLVTEAGADTLSGRASVVDGDTIEIHGERIRILDIDALESKQMCTAQDGSQWRCGQQAALALDGWIGSRTVTCESDKLDRYGRHLARCAVAGQDLAEWLAANGWAVPYRDCKCEVVREAADQARTQQIGIWSSDFQMPWEWRAHAAPKRETPAQQSAGCQIKGNISSKGERIYHVPGGRYYDVTKINESKGERWFCTETEAQEAGWRPSSH